MTKPKGIFFAFVIITTMILTESEIPDDLVIVDVRPVFLRGYDGVLKCYFNEEPLAVFWLKGLDLATATNLVTWYPPPRGVSGSGYESGKYNLTDDFSLVIHGVQEDDAGRYICRISNFRGFILSNYTEATVQNPPVAPFPSIDQCQPEAGGSATDPCTLGLSLQTGAVTTDLTCRTTGASPGVVSLSWTHGGLPVTSNTTQRSTNRDGINEDVMVSITARPSADSYVCLAILSATTSREATASIIVNAIPIVTTPGAVMTTNGTGLPPKPDGKNMTVVVILSICAIIVLVLLILLIFFLYRRRRGSYEQLTSDPRKDKGPVSYLELWELIDMCNIVTADQIVSKLVGNPERESEYDFVRSKPDLYRELCEWKEKSSGAVGLLYNAMEKLGLHIEVNIIKDFRARTNDQVSDDDLEHICWHVHSCIETAKPILRVLYSHDKKLSKLKDDIQIPISSTFDVIKDDLRLMKRWKADSMTADPEREGGNDETVIYSSVPEEVYIRDRKPQTTPQKLHNETSLSAIPPSGNQDGDETNEKTPIIPAGSEEVDLKTKTTAPNQRVRFCLALEEAGTKGDESDRRVYLQLAKTFFQISDECKSELTDEDLKEFALSITKPHCQRLGKTVRLSEDVIAARNEEDLTTMFRTDIVLKAWVVKQECSNYEIRCRLRKAAKRCNRDDIADVFISKDQSEVMSSNVPSLAYLTITNEKRASASESSAWQGKEDKKAIIQNEANETREEAAEASSEENNTEQITAISRDELDRIERYAGTATLLTFCKKYDVLEVPDQQSPEGKELLFETKIINVLKPTLDSEHDKVDEEKREDTPRNVLRRLLQDKQPSYDCLLPRGRSDDIFNVEFIELAFRLVIADVYPFAKALDISDQVLTLYRPNFGPTNLGQGTTKILQAVTRDDRFKMVKTLKAAGYSEEAKAIYFGFEISLGDVVEAGNRVEKAGLATKLDILNETQARSPNNQNDNDEYHQSVLLRWKDTVRSSTFNHRLALADAVFALEEQQLALDIISGVHRKRAMNNPVLELLASTIPEERLAELSKILLDKKVKEGQNCQDVITSWAGETSKRLLGGLFENKPIRLSNKLLDAGFYRFAYEIMAGAWQGKEDKKAITHKEANATREEAAEASREENDTEQGEQPFKEDSKVMEKATNDTSEEGAIKGEETDLETVAETVATLGIPGVNASEEVARQSKEDKNSLKKEVNETNSMAAEITDKENPSAEKQDEKHGIRHKKDSLEETNTTDDIRIDDEDDVQDMNTEGADRTEKNAHENDTTEPAGERLEELDTTGKDEAPLPDTAN